ncbi:MAG: aspartate dehydrogenase [Lachnospiraceae bacterium]|nr:aspartate dehydrogenase [Lachnospiraceae bacterium]
MFGRKNRTEVFDRENEKAVIRSSICTGEKVAGFKNVHTGQFRDVMLIRSDRDKQDFLKKYNLLESDVKTEW